MGGYRFQENVDNLTVKIVGEMAGPIRSFQTAQLVSDFLVVKNSV